MLIDTHAHLYWNSYKDDLNEVIKRAAEADVKTIINVGVDIEKSEIAAKLENDQIKFYSSIGLHPHEAYKYHSDKAQVTGDKLKQDMAQLELIYRENPQKVVAVGECGLDFFFQNNPGFNPSNLSDSILKDLQRKLFKSQIDLSKKLDLPLIVHVRDDRSKNPENIECWLEILDMVKDYKGILHCYSGTMEITKQIPENFLVSFAGTLTYPKNDYLRAAVKALPLEKICLETDCPFLAPQSIRGQRNEPASVLEIAQLIAELKNVDLENVAQKTTHNVLRLLNIA